MVLWSSGDDSWPTPRQRWFESIRDHFWAAGPTGGRRPRTPEMRVQFPRGPLSGGRKAVIRQRRKLEIVGSIPTPLIYLLLILVRFIFIVALNSAAHGFPGTVLFVSPLVAQFMDGGLEFAAHALQGHALASYFLGPD